MPQPTPRKAPLFTVTADTLVAVDFNRRTSDRPPGPYRRLFVTPGARAFTLGNLLARLPMGMFSVSAVVMIAGARGSYALAGAVTATGLATTAVVAPWTARLVDRYGQARIAVPATVIAALGSLALLLCVCRAPLGKDKRAVEQFQRRHARGKIARREVADVEVVIFGHREQCIGPLSGGRHVFCQRDSTTSPAR